MEGTWGSGHCSTLGYKLFRGRTNQSSKFSRSLGISWCPMFWKGPVVLAGHQLSSQPQGWPSARRKLPDHQIVGNRLAPAHLFDKQLRARRSTLIAHVARPLRRHVACAWSALAADDDPTDAVEVQRTGASIGSTQLNSVARPYPLASGPISGTRRGLTRALSTGPVSSHAAITRPPQPSEHRIRRGRLS